jgi:hypothetical protein
MAPLLASWLRHYDPIHRGWTPEGIANGVCATNGYSFPRVAGGYNLYRSAIAGGSGQAAAIVGAAGAKATAVDTFAWRPAAPSTSYAFALTAMGGGGVESDAAAPAVKVVFDEEGRPRAPRPNVPAGAAVRAVSSGRFEVTWRYSERDEETPPATFRVYSDGGGGIIDYGTPIGAVAYRLRGGTHRFISPAHPHGAEVAFAVRAVSAGGADDGNVVVCRAVAMAAGPVFLGGAFMDVIEAE